MTHSSLDRVAADVGLLTWLLVWSVALTIAIGTALHEVPSGDLPEESQLGLGLAIGALSAIWVVTGTWIALIHVSHRHNAQLRDSWIEDHEAPRVKRPRMMVSLIWLSNLAVFCFVVRKDSMLIAQLLLTVVMGIAGPLIVWQWTHQRIHRGETLAPGRRSIRQMLGVTFTIALAIAMLKLSDRWFGISDSSTALILTNAFVWVLASTTMLGRWWGLVVITIPVLIAQWITVSSLVDLRGRKAEAQVLQDSGVIVGFYFFAMLFLMLMRSSGHRWFDSNSLTGDPIGDQT